jgi:hypothetical protein
MLTEATPPLYCNMSMGLSNVQKHLSKTVKHSEVVSLTFPISQSISGPVGNNSEVD